MLFRKVNKILEANGWKLIRIVGSHYRYEKVGFESITVPNHNGRDLSIGVLKDLERKTGLSLRR